MVGAGRRLALFDFDGTLFRLATDYGALRQELAELGAPRDAQLLEMIRALEHEPRSLAAVDSAERRGLESGARVKRGVELYEKLSGEGWRVAIVSHNGRAVIEEFLRAERLPPPEQILDRTALGASKDQSERLRQLVAAAEPDELVLVGDAAVDRLAAAALGAEFVDIGEEP